MKKEYYDASEVKQSCSQSIKAIITDLYPNAKFKGAEARIGGVDGNAGSSMSVSLDPSKFGAYYDHATGEKGDLISLVEYAKNTNYGGAIEWLGASYTNCTKRKFEPQALQPAPPLVEVDQYTNISEEVVKYALDVRKISLDTLTQYNVKSLKKNPNVACFLDYDLTEHITKIEFSDTREKKIWSSKNCRHNLFGKNVVSPDTTKGSLIITEGRWDAMSFAETGLPAVSIPSGAKNHQWIDADWEYIQQFHTIYLAFDMDDEGENATNEVIKRLGIHKCKVIKLPLKDASEMLQKADAEDLIHAFESAATPESGELISATTLEQETYDLLLNGFENTGDEYFVPNYDLRIREHEMTLIFGLTGQGKSQFISNQIAFDASKQIQTTIASFEQRSTMTFASMMKQFSGDKNIAHDKEKFQKAFQNLAPFITIYNSVDRTDPQKLIETFTYAHKRKGINRFVVDNVMSLDSDRDNNAQQAEIAHMFRKFTKDYPIHLFVIAHPRKPNARDEAATGPPSVADIRGASEWGDIPENIITVWRNAKKHETMAEMAKDGRSEIEIRNFDSSIPDGKIYCRKQRATGEYPMENLWFHKESQRFTMKPLSPMPFIEL